MVRGHRALRPAHRDVIEGAFEVAERTLRQVLVPRPRVFSLDTSQPVEEAIRALLASGHSRAPVCVDGDLDRSVGLVHLRDLLNAPPSTATGEAAVPAAQLPESLPVLDAMRRMQQQRQQMVLVIDEHGGVEGIVTMEDLVEEVVGEIYDESDRDVAGAVHLPNGSLLVARGRSRSTTWSTSESRCPPVTTPPWPG